jgi:sporulation protein YlmC with PRC-barrel domain
MRTWWITSAAVFALGLVGPAWSAYGADTEATEKRGEHYTVLRAQDILGMNVRNAKGEELGDVKDLMVDLEHPARVRYAALDYGGFLGVGDKLFAVPWDAMKVRHDADDEVFLELDVTKESLKNAPGFDKDHWPNFADSHWADQVHKHYTVHSDRAKVDVDVKARTDKNGDANRKAAGREDRNVASATLRRASQVEGIEVKNDENEKVGNVEDIVINVDDGKVRYVALSFGGFLGIGDKFFAVPWDAVKFSYDAKDKKDCLIFNADKDRLSNAPGFDKDHWPNFGDPKWSAENAKHYDTDVDKAASRTTRRRG